MDEANGQAVVEDDEAIRRLLAALLLMKALGEGFERSRRGPPLADVRLQMPGIELRQVCQLEWPELNVRCIEHVRLP